ncbi:MAG: hypothetical protein B7Z02_02155 [Rhodobacterales bacterium 32-67-9]|nr:MAG: hypothetical protein B7Z02_02155 [Rhodobacterales bacterium 32-67-9]
MAATIFSGAAVALVLSGLSLCGAARAETLDCADGVFSISAESGDVAAATCTAATSALTALAECGLEPSRRVAISVVDVPMHPQLGACLGFFDTRAECIEAADPGHYAALLAEGDARHDLPVDIVLRGVVAHEVTHALAAQNADVAMIAPAEHEFVASVFEMNAYGEEARAALLAADPVRPKGSRGMVNSGIYAMAPRVFANNAWQLFQTAEDGCALIRDFLRLDGPPPSE